MSQFIIDSAIKGATSLINHANDVITKSISIRGADTPVAFPDTAYYLPIIYGFTGQQIEKLSDLSEAIVYARDLLNSREEESAVRNAGISSLIAAESMMGARFASHEQPEIYHGYSFNGPIDDVQLRAWGVGLADGTISGVATVIGCAKDDIVAAKIVRALQSRGLLTLLCGNVNGRTMTEQLIQEGIDLGYSSLAVPLGSDTESVVYALGYASRLAFSFGGIGGGEVERLLQWTSQRAPVFVLALGELDSHKCAVAAGALTYGFPLIADSPIPDIPSMNITGTEQIISLPFNDIPGSDDSERAVYLVQQGAKARGIKTKVSKLSLPIPYGPAFEGEVVRRPEMQIEFGGKGGTCFEWLTMQDPEQIQDGRINASGPDPFTFEAGSNVPLGIVVEVAGEKMEKDFEPIMERQIHHFLNGAEGIQHQGQRDITWIRVSKGAFAQSFNLNHLGQILHTRLHEEFGTLVDKVQVNLYTEMDRVKELQEEARKVYRDRNERVAGLVDEKVDTFYSCTLCQSFAPPHVCIISPERGGLCGAYNWFDCRAAHEIKPMGANQPVDKMAVLDPIKGEWEGVNSFVYQHSGMNVERFTLYSIMEAPTTTCGCCECIVSIVPEANGFMVVSRDDYGMTPTGMTFSTLMGIIGGGHQTPGMMGIGKDYLTSPKFISAEGGISRIVWMSKGLKDEMYEKLEEICRKKGMPELLNKIADGTIVTSVEELLAFLEEKQHPALSMEPLL
jgi:acetyl-CoA synthase